MYKEYRKTVFFVITLLLFVSISYTVLSNRNDMKWPLQNYDHEKPQSPVINGPDCAKINENCKYTILSTDPQGDKICYKVKCSDCPMIYLSEECYSGEELEYCHCWDDFYQQSNPFVIKAQAIDQKGFKSDWSYFYVTIEDIIIDIPIIDNFNFQGLNFFYNTIIWILNLIENILTMEI